ncbi:hypothetical protein [Paenibacillus sp. HW567]|uniref:hypothetical protein n=1 Tax=Paenibacillus sp. HW567 TaxID=1034769 RepID=UPI00036F61EB|nr:hypothetical protein [Paenibacillus sp. HW567]
MEQRKSMIEMQWQITEGGRLIPFKQYLEDTVQDRISAHLMANELEETLSAAAAPDAQWTDVVDYIAPIAGWVLCEAVETDRELYNELVYSLKNAFVRLRDMLTVERQGEKVFELDRDHVDFLDDLDRFIQTLVGGGCAVKNVNSSGKGQYIITVGKAE